MNHKLEAAFAKGFYLDCKDGEMMSEHLTTEKRIKYARAVTKVRVYLPNPVKAQLRSTLGLIVNRRKQWSHGIMPYHLRVAEESLRAIIEEERDTTCTWMNVEDYEAFYAKDIPHKVDMCRKVFFETYPKAQRG